MKSFITKLILITLAIALIGALIFSLLLTEYYLPVFPYLLGFFFVVTLVIHAYQHRLAKKDMGKFTRSSMLFTFFKLLLYSVIAIVYIALYKEKAIQFVAVLMFLYVVYSIFEVSETIKTTKSIK